MEVFAARTPTRPRAEQKSLPIAETVIAFSRRGHPKRAPWFGGDLTVDVVDDERIARLTTRYRVSRPAKHAARRRFLCLAGARADGRPCRAPRQAAADAPRAVPCRVAASIGSPRRRSSGRAAQRGRPRAV